MERRERKKGKKTETEKDKGCRENEKRKRKNHDLDLPTTDVQPTVEKQRQLACPHDLDAWSVSAAAYYRLMTGQDWDARETFPSNWTCRVRTWSWQMSAVAAPAVKTYTLKNIWATTHNNHFLFSLSLKYPGLYRGYEYPWIYLWILCWRTCWLNSILLCVVSLKYFPVSRSYFLFSRLFMLLSHINNQWHKNDII